MSRTEIHIITALTSAIFGSLSTAAYSVYNTKFEALTGLYAIFAIAALALVIACIFTSIEDEDRFFTVNRLFVLITAVVFTAAPYLLWAYRIVYFN